MMDTLQEVPPSSMARVVQEEGGSKGLEGSLDNSLVVSEPSSRPSSNCLLSFTNSYIYQLYIFIFIFIFIYLFITIH